MKVGLGSLKGPPGDKGDQGPANSLVVDSVTTGEAGTSATVTISGTSPNQKLSFVIPKGDKGAKGDDGGLLDQLLRSQATLYGKFLQNLRLASSAIPTKIVIRGDSVTYGHDTVSADKVPAPAGLLPDGSAHSFTRSPSPWPSVLESRLNEVYGSGTVQVINQGYSGDWVKRGYERWLNNVGAHLTIYAYGINDAQASYVPDDIRNNIDQLVIWIEKMLIRDLGWGSAVVFATPTKQMGVVGQTGANEQIDVFREVYYMLGQKYNVPVIDMEPMLANINRDAWSDTNHLTTKGNTILGSKMAAPFVGAGPQHVFRVYGGSKMLPRPTLDNYVMGANAALATGAGVATPDEGFEGIGSYGSLNTNVSDAYAYFSFYAEVPDLFILPYIYQAVAPGGGNLTIDIALDFGVEQGDVYHDDVYAETSSWTILPSPTASKTISAGTTYFNTRGQGTGARRDPAGLYGIRISTPGWHTLRVKASQSAPLTGGSTFLHMLEFVDYGDWKRTKRDYDIDTKLATTPTQGLFYLPIPPVFSEAQVPAPTFTETRIKWADVLAACGVSNWDTNYYRAPMMSLVVTSYAVASIKYLFKLNASPEVTPPSGVPTKNVGAALSDSAWNFAILQESEVIPLSGNVTPKTSVSCRELASMGYDSVTRELVLTWKTTTSDGTTPRDMAKNFVMSIHPRV